MVEKPIIIQSREAHYYQHFQSTTTGSVRESPNILRGGGIKRVPKPLEIRFLEFLKLK